MKLFGALIAAAYGQSVATEQAQADWPGLADAAGETCGSFATVPANAVNSTCTISTGSYNSVFTSIAGAFPLSANTYTGFEGISGEKKQNVLIFWEEHVGGDGEMDNSTCGSFTDVTIMCVNNGAADATANLVGNFISDPRQTSFSVMVANGDENFAIDLARFGDIQNLTQGHCAAEMTKTGNAYSCNFSENNGVLSYFGFVGAAGNNNF